MKIHKNRPEGNAFMIMGVVHRLLKEVGRDAEWSAIQKEMTSGDYENLCAVAKKVTYGSIEVV
jgi:hypothetical protein